MKLHARVSRSLVELVKRFEGLRRRAARLPDGGWTIGYGHTLSAREGAVVSPEDAEALLYYDLSEVAQKLDAWTFSPLNQNQFEALTAFAFNIGLENFRRSAVLKRVNEGQHLQAAAALELWRKAELDGEDLVIDALVRRRAAEKAHYLTPPEGFRPSPTPVIRPTFDHVAVEAAAQAGAGRSATIVDVPLDGKDAVGRIDNDSPPGADDAAFPAIDLDAGAANLQHRLPEDADTVAPASTDPFLQTADAPPPGEAEVRPVAPVTTSPGPVATAVQPIEKEFGASLLDTPVLARESGQASQETDTGVLGQALDESGSGRQADAPLRQPKDRSIVYLSMGLLGVALFLAALFSMLGGKATPANLVVGLLGILLMTPAGGYFLLRRLDRAQAALEL